MEAGQTAGALVLLGTVFVLNPDAAIGAAFGSMFYLLSQEHQSIFHKIAYTLISMVAGYGVGAGYGDGWSLFAAVCGGAGSVVVLSTALDRIKSNESGPLMSFILDLIRGRR